MFNKEPPASAPWVLSLEILQALYVHVTMGGGVVNSVDYSGMVLQLAMHRYGTQRKPVVAGS